MDPAPPRAILLSAGRGSRLGDLTQDRPKCLLEFGGRALIDWQIEILRAAGIEDIVVIVGFGARRVARHLERHRGVRHFYNPFYQVADNLASLWLARELLEAEFLILNGDTLVAPEIVRTVLADRTSQIGVTIARKPAYDPDDMKVSLAGDRVLRVGKRLSAAETHAESIGLLSFRAEGASLFRQAVEEALCEAAGVEQWYLSVIDALARRMLVGAIEVPAGLSAEVDYPADLPLAEALVSGWATRLADSA